MLATGGATNGMGCSCRRACIRIVEPRQPLSACSGASDSENCWRLSRPSINCAPASTPSHAHREPEYIPLPGPSNELGSTIAPKLSSQPSQESSLATEASLESQSSESLLPGKSAHIPVVPSPLATPTRVSMSTFVLPPKKAMLANTREKMRLKQEALSLGGGEVSVIKKEAVIEKPMLSAVTRVMTSVPMATMSSQARSSPVMSPMAVANSQTTVSLSTSPVTSPPL